MILILYTEDTKVEENILSTTALCETTIFLLTPDFDELTASHFYAEILANEGEQRCSEVHLAVTVHRHIHPDELLVGEPVRTLVTKPQRWVHILQHVVHLRIVDLAGGVRIILGPDPHELVEMMRAQDRRVPRKVIEVVHDDGDEEIQHEERAEENERHEVGVGDVGAAALRLLFLGLRVAGTTLQARQHDVRPGLARGTSEKIASLGFLITSFTSR